MTENYSCLHVASHLIRKLFLLFFSSVHIISQNTLFFRLVSAHFRRPELICSPHVGQIPNGF